MSPREPSADAEPADAAPDDAAASDAPAHAGRPGVVQWAGVVLLTACGAASAWLEALLVPYYIGATLVPVTILFVVLGNWYLPRMARALVARTVAAVLPFAAWIAVILLLATAPRPEGDVILPGGGAVEYVGYAVMLGGALVGTVSVVFSSPPR